MYIHPYFGASPSYAFKSIEDELVPQRTPVKMQYSIPVATPYELGYNAKQCKKRRYWFKSHHKTFPTL